jgi:hypothetical protein
MRIAAFRSSVFSIGVAIAILCGCSASQLPNASSKSQAVAGKTKTFSHTGKETFSYTGKEQKFKVPAGVTQITVTATGGGSPTGKWSLGANGGRVLATIPVTPGETLAVFVGGAGNLSAGSSGAGGSGGFNGGAAGAKGAYYGSYSDGGAGGGGASDLREGGDTLANRVLVAGGAGGGGGGSYYAAGGKAGAGGGKTGGSGGFQPLYFPAGQGGKGGSQSAGGKGGRGGQEFGYRRAARGHRGDLGTGGSGGGGRRRDSTGGGGGGGGGYYGGGGGGAGGHYSSGPGGAGGGGGGSSYVEPGATHVKNARGGASSANGQIVISW